ncbi:MAG: UDP-N-acetylmuramate dehydrogenase [Methylococcales bacterium]|nr:UDP-N-acetylmuramate dehydrogenase [Methylococcales bacterium]
MNAPDTHWQQQAPLAKYTSWRVGGPAEWLFEPRDVDELAEGFQQWPKHQACSWLGLGSNLLVRDGGVRGCVIGTRFLKNLELLDNGRIYAEAGTPCAQIARFCVRHGLSGVEFLAGIPGSFGGALKMNAGAFGSETWTWVSEIALIDGNGHISWHSAKSFTVGYRSVTLPEGHGIVGARLKLQPTHDEQGWQIIKALLAKRAEMQPLGQPSCGSVFRNPAGDFAGRLIEACGLKGKVIGDAQVSEKHANFIINRGRAKALDIEQLIFYVQQTVAEQTGITLKTEVCIVGEPE